MKHIKTPLTLWNEYSDVGNHVFDGDGKLSEVLDIVGYDARAEIIQAVNVYDKLVDNCIFLLQWIAPVSEKDYDDGAEYTRAREERATKMTEISNFMADLEDDNIQEEK